MNLYINHNKKLTHNKAKKYKINQFINHSKKLIHNKIKKQKVSPYNNLNKNLKTNKVKKQKTIYLMMILIINQFRFLMIILQIINK